MPCTMKALASGPSPQVLLRFEEALAQLSDGYVQGTFEDRPWGATIRRSADQRRIWLYGEQLGGTDVVSFNFYVLDTGVVLKPCEMTSSKVIDFVLGFNPT
ncbi:hypothetical protein ACIQUG_21325 [Ensifer sp. NPDC090286]|uniref:hypothetical protein n=1 Tax=Ensifer sp. NPDC090286 TaxID=3363991 RepID=UPI00383B2930